jgi:hypothetical protein
VKRSSKMDFKKVLNKEVENLSNEEESKRSEQL